MRCSSACVVARASARSVVLLQIATISGYCCIVNYSPETSRGVASIHDRHRPGRRPGPSPRDPRIEPWRAFLQAHARITRRLDEELRAEHDLSLAEYDALLTIATRRTAGSGCASWPTA